MKKIIPLAAGAVAAAGVALAVPAAAASHAPHGFKPPAVCRFLEHRVTHGSFNLTHYARVMHASPVQVLLNTGYCSNPNQFRESFLRYRFGGALPAGVKLYGPLG